MILTQELGGRFRETGINKKGESFVVVVVMVQFLSSHL